MTIQVYLLPTSRYPSGIIRMCQVLEGLPDRRRGSASARSLAASACRASHVASAVGHQCQLTVPCAYQPPDLVEIGGDLVPGGAVVLGLEPGALLAGARSHQELADPGDPHVGTGGAG